MVIAWAEDFTGAVIDYGSWPDQHRHEYSLADANPTIQTLFPKAGFGGALYAALSAPTDECLGREWEREDGSVLKIERALVDANWGQSTDVVYQFCRQSSHAGVILPSHGLRPCRLDAFRSQIRDKSASEDGRRERRLFQVEKFDVAFDQNSQNVCIGEGNFFCLHRVACRVGDPAQLDKILSQGRCKIH